MFEFLKPQTRGLGALSALLGATALSVSVQAQSNPSAEPLQAVTESVPAPEGQVVARDPDTGKLRAATAEEFQMLQRHRATQRHAAKMEPRAHSSGAIGARLTDEFMSYSVVVKRADGKLVEICVEGADAASKLVGTPGVASSSSLPTE